MSGKNLARTAASVALASTLALGGAGAFALTMPPARAQAQTITETGTFFGHGRMMGAQRSISKAWIGKGKLHVKGKIWKFRPYARSNRAYKKGSYTFRLAKGCKFGHVDASFHPMTRAKFERTVLKTVNTVELSIQVRGGKAVRVYTNA